MLVNLCRTANLIEFSWKNVMKTLNNMRIKEDTQPKQDKAFKKS